MKAGLYGWWLVLVLVTWLCGGAMVEGLEWLEGVLNQSLRLVVADDSNNKCTWHLSLHDWAGEEANCSLCGWAETKECGRRCVAAPLSCPPPSSPPRLVWDAAEEVEGGVCARLSWSAPCGHCLASPLPLFVQSPGGKAKAELAGDSRCKRSLGVGGKVEEREREDEEEKACLCPLPQLRQACAWPSFRAAFQQRCSSLLNTSALTPDPIASEPLGNQSLIVVAPSNNQSGDEAGEEAEEETVEVVVKVVWYKKYWYVLLSLCIACAILLVCVLLFIFSMQEDFREEKHPPTPMPTTTTVTVAKVTNTTLNIHTHGAGAACTPHHHLPPPTPPPTPRRKVSTPRVSFAANTKPPALSPVVELPPSPAVLSPPYPHDSDKEADGSESLTSSKDSSTYAYARAQLPHHH